MPKPVFLSTQFGPETGKGKASRYGKEYGKSGDTWWKVGLVHGYFTGMGLNFYFETESQASRFSLWTLYDQDGIIKAATPERHGYVVRDVWESWYSYGMNNATGKPWRIPSWIVGMDSPYLKQRVEMRFPDEAQARRFGKGNVYTVQDLVGTLRAVPFDLVVQLQEAADQARFAQQQADAEARLQKEAADAVIRNQLIAEAAEIARQHQPPPPPPDQPPPPPPLIESKSIFDIATEAGITNFDLTAAQSGPVYDALYNYVLGRYGIASAEAVRAQLVSDAFRAEQYGLQGATYGTPEFKARTRTYLYAQYWHPTGRTLQTTDQEWFISNGGSVGNYDGQHFLTGTFPYAVSGLWFGSYVLA